MKLTKQFRLIATVIAWFAIWLAGNPCQAAFHLWHVKEVFSNTDGSVQFIELFNSSSGEWQVNGKILRTNSDGVIKDFPLPGHLPSSPSTAGKHMLIATPDYVGLPGAPMPNYTLPDPDVNGLFFNPNANSISISFLGSGDFMTFSGAALPKDGFHSLTDLNATGFSVGNANNIVETENSPTRFADTTSGQIDLRAAPEPTGDYNGNGIVDAADYTVWRDTLGQSVETMGDGADGDQSGEIDAGDYTYWVDRFGDVVSEGGASAQLAPGDSPGANSAVPEPTITLLATIATLMALLSRRRSARVYG